MNISFFLPTLKFGGIEANSLRLASAFIDSGYNIDLVVGNTDGEYIKRIDERINLLNLNKTKLHQMFKPLVKYLKENKPDIIYTGGEGANILLLLVKKFVPGVKVVISIRTQLSVEYTETMNKKKKFIYPILSRSLYSTADGIVAVSNGVATDASQYLSISQEKINVIYNPILNESMFELMNESLLHPWLDDPAKKVLISVGRLVNQKDFPTLLRAFNKVNRYDKNTRLIILGEGNQKDSLKQIINEMQLNNTVELIGFAQNPYKYMKRADLFVLSSKWEGFGNVVVEALATGTKIVSTDCPSGPSEILNGGQYGRLAEIKNEQSLAEAIISEIKNDSSTKEERIRRANEFTVEIAKEKYLRLFNMILS